MQARPEVQLTQRGASITVADVQALLLWVLADGNNPKWAFVQVRLDMAPTAALKDAENQLRRHAANPDPGLPV
jgi:hypothetical protein